MNLRKIFSIPTLVAHLLSVGMPTTDACASVVMSGTRVIYQASDAEATIKLTNDGKTAALVQTWIDNGDTSASPAALDVPFTVMPPIARIDPGKAQTLRIVATGDITPSDKESVPTGSTCLKFPPSRAGAKRATT